MDIIVIVESQIFFYIIKKTNEQYWKEFPGIWFILRVNVEILKDSTSNLFLRFY